LPLVLWADWTMADSSSPWCDCPFCVPRKFFPRSFNTDQLFNWRLWMLMWVGAGDILSMVEQHNMDRYCLYRVLLVSRVSSGATVHSRKSPAHTAGEKKASEATIYSQKVLINASESVCTLERECVCVCVCVCVCALKGWSLPCCTDTHDQRFWTCPLRMLHCIKKWVFTSA
jgi:hypothetical protein